MFNDFRFSRGGVFSQVLGISALIAVLFVAGCTTGGGATFTVTTPSGALATVVVNSALAQTTLAASNGTAPYTWSVTSGSLPAGVTLTPAGVLSGTPTAFGTFNFTVQVSDSATPAHTATANFSVLVNPALVSVALNPTTVTGGTSSTGTVTLNGAAASAATVTLASNSAAATVPASVSVAAGATTATFQVTSQAVTSSTPATITATYGVAKTATLTVNPPTVVSVALTASTVTGGSGTTGTVTLSGPAAVGGDTVTLLSSNAAAQVAASVIVPAGQSTAQFNITTSAVSSSTPASIQATFNSTMQSATLTVVPVPVIASFTPLAATITAGGSTKLTAMFSNGTGAVNPGAISVTSGTAVTITPAATTTYTLTVTNAAGTAVTAQTTVTVVPAPLITGFTSAASTITAGTSTTLTAVFSNGTGSVDNSVGTVTSGTAVTITPAATTTYTLTVTNTAGTTVTAQATVNVVPSPSITSFTAGSTTITAGSSTTLTGIFSNGTGVINPGAISVTSGQVVTVTPATTTIYTLTVTNTATTPATTTATVTITVDVPPAFTSANNATFTVGVNGTFSVTTSGNPAPSLVESGSLPSGVTFVDNGGGNGTLSGTPASGTAGSYPITFTATNAVGTIPQSFTLTVVQPPSITSLSQPSGSVGTSIIISGAGFGTSQGSSTVTFNGTSAGAATLWSATSVTVTVPVGATTGNVVVTVFGVASNGVNFTVAPTVSSLSQASGAVGVTITITGTNYGSTQGSSTVTFNGTAAAAASTWSATSITLTVPVGATSGNVIVTVGGLASNGVTFTVVQAPAITSLSQPSGAVGTPITITGTSFGSTQGSSTVTFGGTSAGAATSWSATSITVAVPSGAPTGNVVVTVLGSASNGSSFTVTASCSSCTLSGTVTGPWVSGVTITLSGTASPSTTTNSSGQYSFTGLASGSYTITPTLAGYTYSPAPPTINITSNTTQDFTATSAMASYSISGTVSYAGSKTGTMFIRVFPSGCTSGCSASGGTSLIWSGPSTNGSYTVRGLAPQGSGGNANGSYVVTAEIDTLGTGLLNASDPSGSVTPPTITNANLTGQNITVTDPATPTPTTPTGFSVAPGPSGAVIQYNPPVDANGNEIATSYKVYYGTGSSSTNGAGSPKTFTAQGTNQNVFFFTGLTNGLTYNFKMTALVGSTESAPTSVVSQPIGAVSGGNTVSGTVTYTGATTGPLYVGVFSNSGIFFTSIASPVSPQAYSITGVPSGTYQNFAIIDMNNNGIIDVGDISNTGENTPTITVSGNTTGNITLPAATTTTPGVATNYQLFNGTGTYDLSLRITWGSKRPVAMTLFSGPNVPVPFDMSIDEHQDVQTTNFPGSAVPVVGDTYQFQATFSDGTTSILSASVTGVYGSSNVATSLLMSPLPSPTDPTLTWGAPATPPAGTYTYSVGLYDPNGGTNWYYSGGNNSNGIPSSTLSVQYNVDGSANPNSPLAATTTYNWYVQVQDTNRNTAQVTTTYTTP